jgi:quercetin dioxygenase-like cupin family protein
MTAYALTPHEHVAVTHRGVESLVVHATYAPAGSPPPRHLHPFQDERFEVLSGALTVEIHGTRRTLWAGAELEVPRGTPHRMWNDHATVPAQVSWATSPAGRTEQWWAALDAAGGGAGRPPLRRMLALLREYGDVFRVDLPNPARPVVDRLLHARPA